MIAMLKKLCPRCRKLIPISRRYCDECQSAVDKQRQQSSKYRHKRYNDQRADKQEQRFYKSRDWETLRLYLASKYHGLCILSYVIDHKIVPYYTMHHIIPVKDDWSKRFSIGNIIPVSESWHQRVEKAYREGKKAETQKILIDALAAFEKTQGVGQKV